MLGLIAAALAAATAPYAPPLQLSVRVAGAGTVNGGGIRCARSCSEFIAAPAVIALTPSAARGSYFVGWGGACWGEGACTVVMNAPQSVQAAFITLPNTRLRSHTLSATTLKLAFGGTGGAGPLMFQCKLDGRRFRKCIPPTTFSDLAPGGHTLAVRVIDGNSRRDPTPAKLKFTVG